jgi:hypothetical protein
VLIALLAMLRAEAGRFSGRVWLAYVLAGAAAR